MVYQRVSPPSSGNSHVHKKDSASTAHTTPVPTQLDSASPQEQEMPSYTPLPANWATNNNLMRSLNKAEVVQRQEESGEEEMEPIQAKLTIGEVGDKYEQEADQTAQQVVNQINTPAPQQSTPGQSLQREEMPEEEELQMKPELGIIQREEMPEEEELQMKPVSGILQREEMLEEEEIQMKSASGIIQREDMPQEEEELQMKPMVQRKSDGGMDATPDLEASIQQAKGGGQPLADNIRQPMEQAFGADFSGVNVHTDAKSNQLNQSIQAKAFTTGQDVFFRQGAYDPSSRGGQELLAHELTHVVQQNGGAVQPNRIQRFEFNPFVTKRSLTEDLSYHDVDITEEQANPLEKIGISADIFMRHYRNGVSVEDMVQIAEFALNKFPTGGQAAFEVAKYLFNAKLLLGSVQQFTNRNLSLLYSLWNKLKVVATQQLVNLVVSCAADNPLRGLLFALLKEGITLNAITIDLLNHLKPFANKILVDTQALLRAHTVATDHPEDLDKLEEWGFDRANYDAAQIHAEEAKQKHLTEGMATIKTSEKTKQDKAIKDKLEEAKEKLFSNETKRKKAFPSEPPQLKSALLDYNKNQENLKSKQKELAEKDFEKFAKERQDDESKISSEAEQLSTQDQEKYKFYLATINYDKKASQALKFAKDNFDDATKIVLAMQKAPAILNIVEGFSLSVEALIRCIDILGVVNLGTLLSTISTATLKVFSDKEQRLKLLCKMQSDNINVGKIQGLVSEFGTFDKYCDSGSIPHFSSLLKTYTIADIKNLLSASLSAATEGQRMAFLVNIMQYANSPNDMVKFLTLAKKVSDKCEGYAIAGQWKADAIKLALHGQPLGMDEQALKQVIVTNVLSEIDKKDYFNAWISVLNVLIQEDLVTIHKGSDWYPLNPDDEEDKTEAIEYTVNAKDGGAVLESFVAHWHPGATNATTKNPNASKKHLKPIHGNKDTLRVYENSVPKPLAERLLWGTH